MVSVFIDGGGNYCAGVKRYLGKLPAFDKIYVFEPNPLFHGSYNKSGMVLVKKAMWTSDGVLPFYLSKDERQVASSLLEEKLCKVGSQIISQWHDSPIQVSCVDFSSWLARHVEPGWEVTLKLDIEGAEFDVLNKLISDKTIHLVKKLYVEFHLETVKGREAVHAKLLKDLDGCGLSPLPWD